MKQTLDNIFEIKIPDEQIVIKENGSNTLKLKIIFPNGKYFYIQPPTYMNYMKYYKEFSELLSMLYQLNNNFSLLNLEDLQKDNTEINEVLQGLLNQFVSVLFIKNVKKKINRILKKYFLIKGRFGFDRKAIKLKDFYNYMPFTDLFLILSIFYNQAEFIKKNVKFLLQQMGASIPELQELSKFGEKNFQVGDRISFSPDSLKSSSISDAIVKESPFKTTS
jgi:hypothetical protein